MVREELHHLSVGIEASRREALLYQDEILARSMQALTSRLSEFESGRGMFRDVLESRRMLLESQLMSARAAAEQHQMLAEMLLWSGLENVEVLAPLANEPPLIQHVAASGVNARRGHSPTGTEPAKVRSDRIRSLSHKTGG